MTWNKENGSKEPSLRGCKGTFAAREIHEGLKEFALIRWVKLRFALVTLYAQCSQGQKIFSYCKERNCSSTLWSVLIVQVWRVQTCLGLGGKRSSTLCSSSSSSPLFAFKALFVFIHCTANELLTVNNEVGTHGIIIDFTDGKGNNYNATYLPEVATEQGNTLTHM